MAVTIHRTPWVDDDGTGTTGTVINNAVKQGLYDEIDGALALVLPTSGGATDLTRLRVQSAAPTVPTSGKGLEFLYQAPTDIASITSFDRTAGGYKPLQIDATYVLLSLGQLRFPVAQNPSADPNMLDDYREGSWFPTLGGSSGQSGQAYATQAGRYVKIGGLVAVWFDVQLTAKGTLTGNVQLQSLPFLIDASGLNYRASMDWHGLATAFVRVSLTGAGGTATTLFGVPAAATSTITTPLTTSDVTDSTYLSGTFIYRALN
jgi:hypothetical protein